MEPAEAVEMLKRIRDETRPHLRCRPKNPWLLHRCVDAPHSRDHPPTRHPTPHWGRKRDEMSDFTLGFILGDIVGFIGGIIGFHFLAPYLFG